jgi:hypothetical protein
MRKKPWVKLLPTAVDPQKQPLKVSKNPEVKLEHPM